MLQIYTDTGQRVGVLVGCRELHVKHALKYDEKTLYFKYPRNGPHVTQLVNEAYIRTKTDEFVIKLVNGVSTSDWISVTATMNIEGIENCLFVGGFEAVEKTVAEVLAMALADSDWTVGTCEITKKRTIRKGDDCDAWAILQQCVSTYRCEVEIDTLRHVIHIYETRGVDRGVHFMEGVNLKSLTYDRDTYEFFTQIVPVGKNGLTLLSDQDDPVLILEDYTYSKKKVRKVWRDERYTNVKSLREDALAKLEEACKPLSSYTGSVKDLAAGSTDHPDFFNYGIGDTIHLISKSTGTKEKQRIVEIDEYEDKQNNQVEINNVSKSFAQIQRDDQEVATETAARLANGYTDAQLEDYVTNDEVGDVVQETTQVELDGYATKDDLTNATNYATTLVQQAQEDAEAAAMEYANTAEANAKRSFQEALASYYTADETDNAIAEAIATSDGTTGATYATIVELEEVRAVALAAQETADAAQMDATDALALAAAAMDTAEAAQRAAQAAQDTANAAQDKETGRATTDENGTVTVALTEDFATAAAGKFRVWLQALGTGEVYVSESDTAGFTAIGPASLTFDWLAIRYTETTTEEPGDEEGGDAETGTEEPVT